MTPPSINGDGKRLLNVTATENRFNDIIPETNKRTASVEFTYTLAHEIRNPLSTINLAVEMLKITNDAKEKEACLDIIMRNSTRINGLLTDLLNSYQLDEIRLEKYSINQLIDEVLFIIRDRLKLK